MYIYKITNKNTHKVYIGQTINPIEKRFQRHLNDAINNVLNTHLARSIRKHGVEAFEIELIDTASSQEELNLKEQKWIQEYNSTVSGYNETDAIAKCGGNTYQYKSNGELNIIREKIRATKIGALNPNSKRVKVLNQETHEEMIFDTVKSCQEYFNESHHRFITTRVQKKTKSLYKGIWNIAYVDEEYGDLSQNVVQSRYNIKAENKVTKEVHQFKSIRSMCGVLGLNRHQIKGNENIQIGDWNITFH